MTSAEPGTATSLYETELRIEAPPEVVFRYLTESELAARWDGRKAELDPRPGGIYRVEVQDGWTIRGEFVEVDPPRRVVYTFGWEGDGMPVPPGSTQVAMDLTADGDATLLHVQHAGLPSEAVEGHRAGWDHYLARLVIAARGDDPGPDPGPGAAAGH